jgi:uncharacterized protein GlcG (DUF336 family)
MITFKDAKQIVAEVENKAVEIGQPMNIALVDNGGNLLAHLHIDGAWVGSIDISIKKGFTSRTFDISTKDLTTECQPGGQFYGIKVFNNRKVMIFAVGILLRKDGQVVRAIGVNGDSGVQDQSIAEAGIIF